MFTHALTVCLFDPVRPSVLPTTETTMMPKIIVVRKAPVSSPASNTVGRGRVNIKATMASMTG